MRKLLILLFLLLALASMDSNAILLRCDIGNSGKIMNLHSRQCSGLFKTIATAAGYTYTYHVEDISKPTPFDDYVIINDDKYHIIYPLYCEAIK